jgi:hypothetical protein
LSGVPPPVGPITVAGVDDLAEYDPLLALPQAASRLNPPRTTALRAPYLKRSRRLSR